MQEDAPDPLYLPSTQSTHSVALLDECVPASHDVQLDDPLVLMDPALHDSQLVCPVAPWYRPASHASQDVDELEGCAVPPSHSVQPLCPDSPLNVPASHTEHDAAPDPLYLPASHSKHDVALGDEYVPASQSEQLDSPTALILPPSHERQLV